MSSYANYLGWNTGEAVYECDGIGCNSHEEYDFDDGLDWTYLNKEVQSEGWIFRKINGDWMHFCSRDCWKTAINL